MQELCPFARAVRSQELLSIRKSYPFAREEEDGGGGGGGGGGGAGGEGGGGD